MWISRPGESLGSLATRLILWGDRDMELDLIYYRRRMAEELGIPLNALRIRVHRIRTRLAGCVRDSLRRLDES